MLECGRTRLDHWIVADRLLVGALWKRRPPGPDPRVARSAHPLSSRAGRFNPIAVGKLSAANSDLEAPLPISTGAAPGRRVPAPDQNGGPWAGVAHTRNESTPSAPTTPGVTSPRLSAMPAVPAENPA